MESEALSPEVALQGMIVLTAIPTVVFALWCDYFERYVRQQIAAPASEKNEEGFDKTEELYRLRTAGFVALLFQLVIFLGSTQVRTERPWIAYALFLGATLIQAVIQAHAERLVRPTLPTQTADQAAKSDAKGKIRIGLRAFFGSLAGATIYVATVITSVVLGALIAKYTHASQFVCTFILTVAAATGVVGGIGLIFALAPIHLRATLPTSKVENPDLLKLLEECFSKAGLKSPAFWIIELEQFRFSTALIAGFKWGVGPLRPALFISRSIVASLSPSELRATILHEVAHIKLSHLKRRFLLSSGLIIGTTFMATFVILLAHLAMPEAGTVGMIGPLAGFISFIVTFRILAQQNQLQEIEADLHSIEVLGSTADDLAGALRKLDALNGIVAPTSQRGSSQRRFASHPATERRIAIMREYFGKKAAKAAAAAAEQRDKDDIDRAA